MAIPSILGFIHPLPGHVPRMLGTAADSLGLAGLLAAPTPCLT